MSYRVDHHGTSGRWYPLNDNLPSMFDALTLAEQTKKEGYGVRIVRQADGVIVMDAPNQTPVDWVETADD